MEVQAMRELLAREFGINSAEELIRAIENQQDVDIGVFVKPCRSEQSKAS